MINPRVIDQRIVLSWNIEIGVFETNAEEVRSRDLDRAANRTPARRSLRRLSEQSSKSSAPRCSSTANVASLTSSRARSVSSSNRRALVASATASRTLGSP